MQWIIHIFIARSKRDGTRAETRFGLSAKRTSPFKSARVSIHSTAGSRGVRISGQWLYRPCSDVQCKAAGYPLHSHLSPSIPLACVTLCHQVPNALYHHMVVLDRYTHSNPAHTCSPNPQRSTLNKSDGHCLCSNNCTLRYPSGEARN